MSASTSKHHGKFCWYDLMSDDTKAAASFYHDVIGWEANDAGVPGQPYTLFSKGPAMVAGLMPFPDEARNAGDCQRWTGYIAVDNVDDYAKRVTKAGGSVHRPPADIPGVGRFAVVSDPHSSLFILFKASGEPPPGPEPAPGTPGLIGWHELQAGDLDGAFNFYSGLFGWTKADAVDMGAAGVYQLFATGGAPVGGMMKRSAEAPRPYWLYYFNVDGIDSAIDRTSKAGGKVTSGPHPVPGGSWIAHCTDPLGARFAMVGPKR
jgi:predicted enzyme related to lactoylglutathione lyase